jgi:adenine-specific DNA methylase
LPKADIIITDPPYYAAIPYSDLMDWFYIWLRRIVFDSNPSYLQAMARSLGPKWDHESNDGELVDDAARHLGDLDKSKLSYESGMARAFSRCAEALEPTGRLVVVFANKQPDAWETLVSALIAAGFVVDGSWPIQTEQPNRSRGQASAALASSVWLVCKKRPGTARPGWDNKVLDEMRANIGRRLREFWDADIRGPDFVWAATGPALEAYSQHPVVKMANDPGLTLTVSEFLNHARRMVVDFVVGRVLEKSGIPIGEAAIDRLDEPTAYYLLHRNDFGSEEAPAGACILYATACGLSDQELIRDWDILVKTGGSETNEDEEEEAGDDEEPADQPRSGGRLKLKPWNQRRGRSMGYEAPGGRPVPLIDRIHRLMLLWRGGDVHKVDEYLDEHGLRRHELFRRVLQSLIELSKPGGEERSLLESLSNHIGAKGAKKKEQLTTLAFGEDDS